MRGARRMRRLRENDSSMTRTLVAGLDGAVDGLLEDVVHRRGGAGHSDGVAFAITVEIIQLLSARVHTRNLAFAIHDPDNLAVRIAEVP